MGLWPVYWLALNMSDALPLGSIPGYCDYVVVVLVFLLINTPNLRD